MRGTTKKLKSTDPVVRELESDILLYDMNLRFDPKDDNGYYMKGVAYVKLFKHTKSDVYAKLALKAFDKAVELTDAKNTTYLADRSKLHVAMGDNDLAVSDIAIISKLPRVSGIEGFYANNTVRDIAKLEAVQDSVNKLGASGKIPKELAEAINSHAKITASLVVQVDEHGNRISDHDDKIEKLELIVNSLVENKSITREQIVIITRELEAIDKKVADHEARITRTEVELRELADKWGISQQAMEEMKASLEALEIDHENMLTAIDHIVDNMGVIEHDISRVRAEDAAKAELQEMLSDPYKSSFYYGLRSELNATYMAAKVVQTDIISNTKTGLLGDVGGALQTVSRFIPVFGSAVGFFSTILSMVDKTQQKAMVARYANIAVSEGDMDQISEKVALSLLSGEFLQEATLKSPDNILEMCVGIFQKAVDVMSLYSASGSVVGTATAAAEDEVTNRAQSMGASFISNFKKNKEKVKSFFKKLSKQSSSDSSSSSSSASHDILSPLKAHREEEEEGRLLESIVQGVNKLGKEKTTHAGEREERIERGGLEERGEIGEKDASIIANVIISMVYAGRVSASVNIDEVSEEVISLVKSEYGFEDSDIAARTPITTPIKMVTTESIARVSAAPSNSNAGTSHLTLERKEELARDIATKAMTRFKILLKAHKLESDDVEIEDAFIDDLAIALIGHADLLVSANTGVSEKDKIVKKLVSKLKASNVGSINADHKFEISTEFMEEGDFFDKLLTDSEISTNIREARMETEIVTVQDIIYNSGSDGAGASTSAASTEENTMSQLLGSVLGDVSSLMGSPD
jgi:hypothetical protein